MRFLFFFALNDVVAELRLYQVGGLAGLQGKRGLFKGGHGYALLDKAKLAARDFRARVIRVLLR